MQELDKLRLALADAQTDKGKLATSKTRSKPSKMKKSKKTPPPKPPRRNLSQAHYPKKIGGDSDEQEITKLRKDVGFIATGDVARRR